VGFDLILNTEAYEFVYKKRLHEEIKDTPNLDTYLASFTPVTGIIASLLPFSMLMRPMFSFRAKRRNASGTTHVLSFAANS
jgi:hypothetical protein